MKFDPLVKSQNHDLFLLKDNSHLEILKSNTICDFENKNVNELPQVSIVKISQKDIELSLGEYNEDFLAKLRDFLKILEENNKFAFIKAESNQEINDADSAENFISALVHTARRIKDATSVIGFEIPEAILKNDKNANLDENSYSFWFISEMNKKHSHYVYFADGDILKELNLFEKAQNTDWIIY